MRPQNIGSVRLDNNTVIAWTVNEDNNHVMVNESFAGVVELVLGTETDGIYDRITLTWRGKLANEKLPVQLEGITLEAAKKTVQITYLMHGSAGEGRVQSAEDTIGPLAEAQYMQTRGRQ